MKQTITIILLLFVFNAFSQHASLKVIMIRHGEKNDATGNLSCQGLHRALMLPKVLNAKFPKVERIYAPSLNNGKVPDHARMFQTITPYAVQNSLAIDTKYKVSDAAGVAKEVMSKKGLVLLVWEHGNIPDIAKALGVTTPNLQWGSNDFDSIWIVTYAKDKNGNWVASLSTADKEGLNPPTTCNF
ncbi:MAG TPA: histidine phosphatase family protein [Chitinophagaceae bacterium]|nr:histidine phosphatase family protein [Chitinophagaceae bacterium]